MESCTRNNRAKYLELKKRFAETDVGKNFNSEELEPSWVIAKSFPTIPEEHIHIIVQLSLPTTTGKCLPISNKKFVLSHILHFFYSIREKENDR